MIGRNREFTNHDWEISRERRYIGKRVASWAGASAVGGTVAAVSEVVVTGEISKATVGAGFAGALAVAYMGSMSEFAFGYIEASLQMISHQKDLRRAQESSAQTVAN